MADVGAKGKMSRALGRLLRCRRGTAEIIGSVMFLLIMMFFFTNVFLWHDNATREMDGVMAEKMNSVVSIQVVSLNVTEGLTLRVTNNGGVTVVLSRLWIIEYTGDGAGGENHDFDDLNVLIAAGKTFVHGIVKGRVTLGHEYVFRIVTTRGNMAACSGVPYDRT